MSNLSLQTRRSFAARATVGMLMASIALFAVTATSASAHSIKPASFGLHVGVSKPVGGATVVTLDPAAVTALTSLGIAVAPVAPATSPSAGVLSFPVTGGRINYIKIRHGRDMWKQLAGWVDHSGGMTLTKAPVAPAVTPTVVSVSNLRINLSAGRNGVISGKVNSSSERTNLFRMSTPVVDPLDRSVSSTLSLSKDAAKALNGAFGTTAFTEGMKIATAKTTPTF